VKGARGLVGDFEAAALRFLGSGVAGISVTAKSESVDAAGFVISFGAVAEALLLRFLGAAPGFSILVYFASPMAPLTS
jgi:hypothetical protein